MAINYSLVQHYANPLVVNPILSRINAAIAAGQTPAAADTAAIQAASKKWYANAQSSGTLTLEQFAKHIADHGSKYKRADVTAILIEAVECLREQLLLGNSVSLGDLGSFYATIQSEGVENAGDFSKSNIKALNVNWSAGKDFEDLLEDASFHQVLSLANQNLLLKLQNGGTLTAEEQARAASIQALITAANNSEGGGSEGGDDDEDEDLNSDA